MRTGSPVSAPAVLGCTARTEPSPPRAAAASASSNVTRSGRKPGELALAIFSAVATARAESPSSALTMRAEVISVTSFSSLDDDFGVERAGGPDGLKDGDDAARVDVRAMQRLDDIADAGVGHANDGVAPVRNVEPRVGHDEALHAVAAAAAGVKLRLRSLALRGYRDADVALRDHHAVDLDGFASDDRAHPLVDHDAGELRRRHRDVLHPGDQAGHLGGVGRDEHRIRTAHPGH